MSPVERQWKHMFISERKAHIQISYKKYPTAILYVFLLLRQEVIIKKIKLKQIIKDIQ